MRFWYYSVLFAIPVLAQTSSTSSSTIPGLDAGAPFSGPTYQSSRTANSNSRTEYAPGVNGQLVPRESVEEKVLREDASGRTVERYVRKYDQNGNPGPLEKTVIEEKKVGDQVTVSSTTYRGDLNGNLAPAERSVSQTVREGNTTRTNTTVERSGLDGQLTPIERVDETTVQASKAIKQQTTTRMRRDTNGNYYEAVREVKETNGLPGSGTTTENRAQYVDGVLAEQTVARTVGSANGTSTTTVDVYATQAPGLSADVNGGKLALKEQQQIIRQVDGKTTSETVVSRKPNVSDPNRLGPPQTLSKTVCKGTCN